MRITHIFYVPVKKAIPLVKTLNGLNIEYFKESSVGGEYIVFHIYDVNEIDLKAIADLTYNEK